MTLYKVSGGVKDYLVTPWAKGAFKARSYLRARGIPKKEAKALLTFAFANNVLESVNIPSVKSKIKKIIANKLGVDLGFDL